MISSSIKHGANDMYKEYAANWCIEWSGQCHSLANLEKSENMHITKTIPSIPTKVCTTIKTIKRSLWLMSVLGRVPPK